MSSPQLPFDPIEEARRHWAERWPGEAADEMVAVTSVMRVHQILMARLNELLEPFGLTFPRYEALMLLHLLAAGGRCRWGRSASGCRCTGPASPTRSTGSKSWSWCGGCRTRRDRRAVLAEITPAGRKVAEEATETLNEAHFATDPLSDADLAGLAGILQALRVGAGDFPRTEKFMWYSYYL